MQGAALHPQASVKPSLQPKHCHLHGYLTFALETACTGIRISYGAIFFLLWSLAQANGTSLQFTDLQTARNTMSNLVHQANTTEALPLYVSVARNQSLSAATESRGPESPPLVVLQYTVCGNFIEQLYSHLSAFTLAMMLGTQQVVLPAAYAKDSRDMWMAVEPQGLLDVVQMQSTWHSRGLHIIQGGITGAPVVETETDRQQAFQPALQGMYNISYVLRQDKVYKGRHNATHLVAKIRQRIARKARKRAAVQDGDSNAPWNVAVSLPCTLLCLDTSTCGGLMANAALGIRFPPNMLHISGKVVDALRAQSPTGQFNGFLLSQSNDYICITEAPVERRHWKPFRNAMREYFDTAPCYIGMETLFDMQQEVHRRVEMKLKLETPCSHVYSKFQLLTTQELNGLHSEHHKLLDFLVLMEASMVIGREDSLTALGLHEFRYLRDLQYSVVRLVTKKRRGKRDPFAQSGVFTSPSSVSMDPHVTGHDRWGWGVVGESTVEATPGHTNR